MAGPITNYHTDQVVVVWKGINITGFANDTFVEIEREEEGFTTYVGSTGEVCRTKNLNRMAKVTVTLMASAAVNDLLAAEAQDDEDTGLNYGPIMVKDLNSNMRADGPEAWIEKR